MRKNTIHLLVITVLFFLIQPITAQSPIGNTHIAEQINVYKNDVRGPYKNIRWFCDDGTIQQPKEPCPDEIGGIQHATYKNDVVALGKSNHVFLGQILAYTKKEDLWDKKKNHSRLKQYQLGKYLSRIDNGWINQKGQFYRGAIQIEDEEAWGINFYKWLLAKDVLIEKDYFLVLQSLKDIPHKAGNDIAQQMHALSKVISDQFPKFMELRTKIHSNPEVTDIASTLKFKKNNIGELTSDLSNNIDDLVSVMQTFHRPVDVAALASQIDLLSSNAPLTKILKDYIKKNSGHQPPSVLTYQTANILLSIRRQIIYEKNASQRLRLLDIANQLETIAIKEAALWKPESIGQQLDKIYTLSMVEAATGGLELWEWEKMEPILKPKLQQHITLEELTKKMETARGVVEWSSSMMKATFKDVVDTYAGFENKSYGFIDDRIRTSIALQLGKSLGELGKFIAKESSLTNSVLNLNNQSTIRGLNPGYALGELVVVSGPPENIEVSENKIYVFESAPSDLKPVAGIATVEEGNLVSHVQLLARNFGIPNAAISDENLKELKAFQGFKVFYAVSGKGNVILKLADSMTDGEKTLFAKKVRTTNKTLVPVDKIRLDKKKIIDLRDIDAKDSGKLCGPKAANLGQLKELFPDKVVEGFVIPFGIFRDHMNQLMPGHNLSYWQFLNGIFTTSESKRNLGISENEVEQYQLQQLEILREAIKKMPFKDEFISDIEKAFASFLGKPLGSVPVFIRSDTNMEDLKEFTGAGLNLTVFNVVAREKILQGIKDVWASPYKERPFKWRQKYMMNPENVFPSILIIPSVDVDYSGVLITKGIRSGNANDLTIAFSRGAGGAVDGQAAESYTILENGGYELISPARETMHNTLPLSGGTKRKAATFEKSILNKHNIEALNDFSKTIRNTYAKSIKSKYRGAYDIELGFKDNKLWLFQIRPYVENKKALGSDYLESIAPKINKKKKISLSTILL